jgi:hypothetical protein
VATYSGDANNNQVSSGCADEPVKVAVSMPVIVTTQEPASGTVGQTFKDKATISGLFGERPGGTISWKLYNNAKCEGTPVATDGPVSITGNGTYTTPSGASPTAAGTYYWVATYSGDANNDGAVSGCAAEPVTVGPASPTIATTQEPASGTLGATFKDKATIAGLFGTKPGGSISWALYNNNKCEGSPVATGPGGGERERQLHDSGRRGADRGWYLLLGRDLQRRSQQQSGRERLRGRADHGERADRRGPPRTGRLG